MEIVEFKVKYPEFAQIDESVLQQILTNTQSRLDEKTWGDNYLDAVGLLTAHEIEIRREKYMQEQLLSIALHSGMKIPVKKQVSYYEQSMYGQQFKQLLARLAPTGFSY